MKECNKCGTVISDNDMMAWKCAECGKIFKVKLSKLKNLKIQKNKPENAGKTLLKCPACEIGIDDENEKIACQCSFCGNVMRGNLSFFTDEKTVEENRMVPNTISNLIKCPECGKEVSHRAEHCPNCGCPISNKKKMNKKMIIIPTIIVVFCMICGIIAICINNINNRRETIETITSDIEQLINKGVPSQEDFDNTLSLYNALSNEEKLEIKNSNYLDRFKDVDLKSVKNLSERIASIEDTTSFSDLINIENEYKKLSKKEQELLDISPIEDKKSLSKIEKAALSAVNNVKSVMKSKNDFKLYSVSVKDDLKKMNFYWVKVKYSGTNSWGGSIDKTSFFPIDSEFSDPFFGLAAITGMDDYLDNVTNFDAYTDCKEKEYDIDVEKIEYYMD